MTLHKKTTKICRPKIHTNYQKLSKGPMLKSLKQTIGRGLCPCYRIQNLSVPGENP